MRKKKIEFYLAILAIIIALLALIVSALQLELTREHNRLSVQPKILITPYLEGPSGRNGIYIENTGLGPGIIHSFSIDTPSNVYKSLGKNYWPEILTKIDIDPLCFALGWPDPEATLKAGENVALIEVTASKPPKCYLEAFKLTKKKDITLNIEFHSLYDEVFLSSRNFHIDRTEIKSPLP